MFENKRVLTAILLYGFFTIFLVMYFPTSVIDENGEFIAFSLQEKTGTILPFWMILLLLAFVSYCISLFL